MTSSTQTFKYSDSTKTADRPIGNIPYVSPESIIPSVDNLLSTETTISDYALKQTLKNTKHALVPVPQLVPFKRAANLRRVGPMGISILSTVVEATANKLVYSFDSGDMVAGILYLTHNLTKYLLVQVYDNEDKQILPDDVILYDDDIVEIDLTNFTITGTWHVVVI